MTRRRTRQRGTSGVIARGLGAALALVTFVVGVPAALVALSPLYLPEQVPTWGEIWTDVTSPDDGALLLVALAAVAWLTWAAFAASVVVEVVAGARRLHTPVLPLLGGFQRAASSLLATAGLLLAASANVAVSATPAAASALVLPLGLPTAPAAQALTVTGDAVPTEPSPPTSQPAGDGHLPAVTVQRGDTLWDLAERHLGSGQRYTEIADLNRDRIQPDGRRLIDADWIMPGWVLTLPADATELPDSAGAPTGPLDDTTAKTGTVVVQPGDTLWDIAAAHLGDGHRYPEIANLNGERIQPDGDRLTDPELIRPGWVLDLPAAPTTAPVAVPSEEPPIPAPPRADSGSEASRVPVTRRHASPWPAEAAPGTAPTPVPSSPAADADPTLDDSHRGPTAPWFLGLAALGATGVVGEIARRRHLQQRARRVGQTIPLPEPTTPAAAAERILRSAPTPVSIPTITATLANLASRCSRTGRTLPRVGALFLDEHHLTLVLTADDPNAVEPFAAAGPHTWVAAAADVAVEQPIDDPEQAVPYPLLVTLGHTPDSTLIVNLEAAGTLAIRGDEQAADDLLRALVLEAATSDLSGQLPVRVDDQFADLAGAFESFRLRPIELEDDRIQTEAEIAALLAAQGCGDTLDARSRRVLPDTWLPVVHVECAARGQASRPWGGVVTVTRAEVEGAWVIEVAATGTARLEPIGLDFQPQRLTAAHLADVRSLLVTALPPEPHAADEPEATPLQEGLTALRAAHRIEATRGDAQVTIGLLGPIQVRGPMNGRPTSRMVELLVYLALHGPATGADLEEVLWHGDRVSANTRNVFVHRTRDRVGKAVLPMLGDDGRFRLGDGVTTDWARFQQLLAEGLTLDGDRRIDRLRAALSLVRDRPFRGIGASEYAWADYDIQQMTSAITDAAHLLARLLHEAGRHREALDTATHGLVAEPYSEALQQIAIAATRALAGPDEARALRRRYAAALARLDPELA